MPADDADLNSTLDRFGSLLTRRRWWILLTACATTLATAAVLLHLPNRYTSEATLLVLQPQVAERYIVSTSAGDPIKALSAMTRDILSRPRLLGIIDELGLYAEEKKSLAPEEVIERMRKDVGLTPLETSPERRDINGFRISFIANDPLVAQKVTSRLTSLFVETNVKTRSDQAKSTTDFLQERLQDAKAKLDQQEQRLRGFKAQFLGELPEQQQGNLQILVGLQTQLQNAMGNLNRAQQQGLYLESLLSEYDRLTARPAPAVSPSGARIVGPLEQAQKDLEHLKSEKTALLAVSSARHPDVMRAVREIAKQEAVVESLKASPPSETEKTAAPLAPKPGGVDYDTTIAQLKSQLEANRLEIQNLSKDEKQLKASIAQYQSRLNLTPMREQQLAGILREYDLLKQNYADLLGKGVQSQLATGLEKQQENQFFRLVDPPSLPTVPSSPKRLKISLGGGLAGILLGFALAFCVEARDRSFHSENDLTRRFDAPLIIGIPPLFTPAEERLRNWGRAVEWMAGSVVVLAIFAAEFYVNRHG